jgi:radical SAM superfamily enzyme YgiQ (UPF0313 family)
LKIKLINPPIRLTDKPRHFPVGLGIIASVLLDEGHEVSVLDLNAERLNDEEVENRINLNSEYQVIAIGGLITTYKYLKWIIPKIKNLNPNSIIIAGGGVVTESPTLLLSKTPTDFAIIGEAELTIKELIYNLENKIPIHNIKGIAYKKENDIEISPPRPLIKNLDTIPFPAYDLFPTEIYLKNVSHAMLIGKTTEMGIITSRGCPYDCNYCFHVFGRGARTRSVENVIKHIKLLINNYNIDSFIILDETFTINKKRVIKFCDALLSNNIDIQWSCYARVNLVDLEMLKKMKKSGCYRVGYGIESGSQLILNNMNKKVRVEQARKAIGLTRKAGLMVGATFMFGYLGENLETISETNKFCRETLVKPSFFFSTPFPGTDLYFKSLDRILEEYGSEEKYIEILGDVKDFTINLTDFTDKELIAIKRKSEVEIQEVPIYKRLEHLYIRFKQLGLLWSFKHLIRKAKRYIKRIF